MKKISKNVVVNAKNEVLAEVLPNGLKVIKTLNKLSKVDGSAVARLFGACGVDAGKLTFEFFAEYNYNLVAFPLSSSVRSSLGGDVVCPLSAGAAAGLGVGSVVRAGAAASLAGGDDVVIRLKDSAVCTRFELYALFTDGSCVPYVLGALARPDFVRLVRVGAGVLENSCLAYMDLMRVIGNRAIDANKAGLRRERLMKRYKDAVSREYNKRVRVLGDVPVHVLDVVRMSVEKEMRVKFAI